MTEHEKKLAKLVDKALKDPKLKAKLLADPNGVVEAEMKVELPKGLKVKVIEDTQTQVHFVLPMDYRLKGADAGKMHVGKGENAGPDDKRRAVIERAWADAAFKAKLLKSPQPTLEREAGLKFPAGAGVKVLEDTDGQVHLVLPRR